MLVNAESKFLIFPWHWALEAGSCSITMSWVILILGVLFFFGSTASKQICLNITIASEPGKYRTERVESLLMLLTRVGIRATYKMNHLIVSFQYELIFRLRGKQFINYTMLLTGWSKFRFSKKQTDCSDYWSSNII